MTYEIILLNEEYDKPSFNDLSVLVLAKQMRTILITGDENLRHAAISKGVSCHGTCWLIDYLMNQSLLSPGEALASYERMKEKRRYPPMEECKALSSRWKERKKLLEWDSENICASFIYVNYKTILGNKQKFLVFYI